MNRQRGLTLTGMILWCIVIALVVITGMRVVPSATEYYKILKDVKAVAGSSAGKTVPEIRKAFDRYADVDHVKDITSADLEISKDGNGVVISFSYEKRIPLFANVSLLIDYQGSSSGRDKGE